MSIYVQRDSSNLYPPARIACFVCGCDVPADYPLFTEKPAGSPEGTPHFPFLLHQSPPLGCKSLTETNGIAKSCRVCYSMLMNQWENHQRDGVPPEKRIYWLKRNDVAENNIEPGESTGSLMPPAPPPPRGGAADNDSALDLSSGSRDRDTMKSRSSINSNVSANTHYSSQQSEGGAGCSSAGPSTSSLDNLVELALPDKNAATEVCYSCGDEFKKGSLSFTFSKSMGNGEPFYGNLLCHSRPPGSQPMDFSGRVLTCDECHNYLLGQWHQFEAKEVPHSDRNYALRKRDSVPLVDSTIFVCYTCSLDYHSSCLRLLYSRPNADGEPYYPFIEHKNPPPGASPISPQGMVQVCMVCCKSIKGKHAGCAPEQPPPPKKRRSALVIPNDEVQVIGGSLAGVTYSEEGPLPSDVTCPLCRRKFSIGSFKHLHTKAPPLGGIPYFPFLDSLQLSEEEKPHLVEDGEKRRVRACRTCTTSLVNQWTSFQKKQIPPEDRSYSYVSLASPRPTLSQKNSPDRKPDSSPEAPIRTRSNTLESRPRSSSPRVRHSPPTSESKSNSTSSFYCFLCGLHSELSFSRVLYSRAPAKKAPYFPFMKTHVPKPRAETLREDGTALVCTFCYHSVMSQWSKHNESKNSIDPSQRKYDIQNFICFVCGVTTYRKRIRALRVVDFPFLRHHKSRNKDVIILENGEMVPVCLDCFDRLRSQYTEGAKYGIPVDKRQYNWMQIPPPPEEASSHIVTAQERLQKVVEQQQTTTN